MIYKILSTAISALALGACTQNPRPTDTPATDAKAQLYISGSTIYSGLSEKPDIADIAVRNGIITCTSSSQECRSQIGPDTHIVKLSTNVLYPGFTDSHAHLLGIGMREMTLNLEGTESIAGLQDRVRQQVQSTPKGQTIFGRGWIETHWPENRFPKRSDLDVVSTDHPIILTRADGHATVVNSTALELSNIDANTKAPFGGDILRGAGNAPTGMLIDNAQNLISGLMDTKMSAERKRTAYAKASDVYTSYGWTGLHNMSVDTADIQLMNTMSKNGQIDLRVYNSLDMNDQTLKTLSPDFEGKIITRAIKLYADGALGSRGAALLAEYDDDKGNRGLVTLKKPQALPLFQRALREGIQINTHAIGDRGNRFVLDWYEEAFAAVPVSERAIANPRWRIEHSQIINLDDIPRFAALNIIPSMQPSHAIGDLHFAVDRIGTERLKGGYSWRSLIDSGVIIPGGSDAPVERGDPRIEFYAATARKDAKGFSGDGWYPEQKVTRYEALKMFTQWAAFASFQEEQLGTIEVGKRADFSVFDKDLMTIPEADILTTNVAMTIINGQIVYER